ncbi:MAG: hypothetical protein CFE24_02050 [Flavobacterium sp. BFFFF2]|nr:MAG: hypothetical protein CFE24_02050 [Flavobacterium sp. BFFFF2]
MSRTNWTYLILFVLAMSAMMWLEMNKPVPFSWEPQCRIDGKQPFDLFILKDRLKQWQPGPVSQIQITPYQYFTGSKIKTSKSKTYLYISYDFQLDQASMDQLLYRVQQGDQLFISARTFPQKLLDTLALKQKNELDLDQKLSIFLDTLHKNTPRFSQIISSEPTYFNEWHPKKTRLLGFQTDAEGSNHCNFVCQSFGKGKIWLHSAPLAFTNFELLHAPNHLYAEEVLSFLPKQPLQWIVYQQADNHQSNSIFRIILTNPGLKWSFWILLLLVLSLFVFQTKRKQRAIPLLMPLKNESREWIGILSSLYLQAADYDRLAKQKALLVHEMLRKEYGIEPHLPSDEWITLLHRRSGLTLNQCQQIASSLEDGKKEGKKWTTKDWQAFHETLDVLYQH